MATLFEPTFSTSAMRPPLTSASAPNIADSLPSINFGFDELRDRMAKFTTRFDNFIEAGRKRVLEERNQFRMNVAELQEDERMKKKEIEILQLKTSAHAQTLLKETAETAEMNAAIATLTTTRDAHLRTKAQLQEQIASTQAAIDSKLLAQRMHAMSISAQSRHDIPELDFWTQYLGLRIEGAGMSDRIKFVFCQVDERDWGRECSFELDTQSREYKVRVCRPKLEKEMLERLLEGLNEGRALGPFLKGMRDLFVETVKSQ